MNDIDLQESDKLEGTNHPRHTNVIYGHDIPPTRFPKCLQFQTFTPRLDDYWSKGNWKSNTIL